MPEQLKPGAFRVFDNEKGFYDEGDGRSQWFLYGDGRLFVADIYGADEPDPLMRIDEADANRYQVERWTGLYDRDERPLFENDVVWYEDLRREGKQSVAVVKMAKGSWLGLVALGDDDFDFSELHDDFWVNLGQFKHTNKPDLKPLDIGTVHDSPETLVAAAKAVTGE